MHQVINVFLVFQEDALILEGICLKNLLLNSTTMHPVRYYEILVYFNFYLIDILILVSF
jgi:hypothetical protein